jgi:hypothetical protein
MKQTLQPTVYLLQARGDTVKANWLPSPVQRLNERMLTLVFIGSVA